MHIETRHSWAQPLLEAAIQAPSSHNTQPWFFRVLQDGIELYADRERSLPINDPHRRELVISCGCALMNMRVAAAALGMQVRVAYPPPTMYTEMLATLKLSPYIACDTALAPLAAAIPRRHTCRDRFDEVPVGRDTITELASACAHEGAALYVLRDAAQRHALAELVAEADRVQWSDEAWRRELAQWMHPHRSPDGLVLPTGTAHVTQAVVRSFDMGGSVAAKDRGLADGSPLLAVVLTQEDIRPDWLAAGQALQRLLLTGVGHGLQASFLNQPLQVGRERARLVELLGGRGWPQVVLRMGATTRQLAPTPRRALAELLDG